jgi:hypothetical protein
MKKTLAFCTLLSLSLGCVKTSIKSPTGWQASRTAFGLNATVGELTVSNETNKFAASLKGYKSDATAMAEAIAHGVASGLKP